VQPWSLTSWHGRWYVTGHDLDRDAPRVFRLDRVSGVPRRAGRPGGYDVPRDHDALTMIRASADGGAADVPQVVARLLVRDRAASSLRRVGTVVAGTAAPEGWDVLEVPVRSLRALAEEVAAAGPDVRVVEPPELRDQVTGLLRAVVDAHEEQAR
jgi:proteasome accessory factor B